MTGGGALQQAKDRVLEDWLGRLEASKLLMGKREPVSMELAAWLDLLSASAQEDPGATYELHRQVALHARELGVTGKPASAALMQVLLLEDALICSLGPDHGLTGAVREMARVAADAHAMGGTRRATADFERTLQASQPVFHIPGVGVVGCLVGAMSGELIDSVLGRLFRECAGTGERVAVVDVSGAPRDGDTFHRTLLGFTRSDAGARFELVVTGLEDVEATRAALVALGCPTGRIRLLGRLEEALSG